MRLNGYRIVCEKLTKQDDEDSEKTEQPMLAKAGSSVMASAPAVGFLQMGRQQNKQLKYQTFADRFAPTPDLSKYRPEVKIAFKDMGKSEQRVASSMRDYAEKATSIKEKLSEINRQISMLTPRSKSTAVSKAGSDWSHAGGRSTDAAIRKLQQDKHALENQLISLKLQILNLGRRFKAMKNRVKMNSGRRIPFNIKPKHIMNDKQLVQHATKSVAAVLLIGLAMVIGSKIYSRGREESNDSSPTL